MADSFSCGFSRILVFRSYDKDTRTWINQYNEFIGISHLQLDPVSDKVFFLKRAKSIHKTFTPQFFARWQSDDRDVYLKHFSYETWLKQNDNIKKLHTLKNCKICEKDNVQILFPCRKNFNIKWAKKAKLRKSFRLTKIKLKGTNKSLVKNFAKEFAKKSDKKLKCIFGQNVNFLDTLCSIPSMNITRRKNHAKKHRTRRKYVKTVLKDVAKRMNDSVLDANLMTNESFNRYDIRRKIVYFERKRKRKDVNHIEGPSKKRHTSDLSKYDVDLTKLLEEVSKIPLDVKLNCAELFRNFPIKYKGTDKEPINKSQVMKEVLKSKGVDHSRFVSRNYSNGRSSKKRLTGGFSIPVPKPMPALKMEQLQRIKDGKINLGDLIAPFEINRKIIDRKTGFVRDDKFTVYGRRIPLHDICRQTLKDHEENGFIRDTSDDKYAKMSAESAIERLLQLSGSPKESANANIEKIKSLERRRYIQVWHDNATIANHSHLLVMLMFKYDEALYLTNKEYFEKTGKKKFDDFSNVSVILFKWAPKMKR